jgi:hypothetical protein
MNAATSSEPISLQFHSHPSVLVVIAGLGVFFWWAFTRLGPTRVAPGEVVATKRQKQWVIAGLVWTFVFSYWPLHDISEKYLFLVHMIQHSVFTMVAPACFLLGAPKWLWRWVLDTPVLGSIIRFEAAARTPGVQLAHRRDPLALDRRKFAEQRTVSLYGAPDLVLGGHPHVDSSYQS